MSRQVLIINVTRMGDLVQMTPLLQRLEYEWPGVAIDLVVDTEFAEMASLLPRIRHVLSYDFQLLMDQTRVRARDLVALYRGVALWAKPLADIQYDRVINLTFNRRSAYLTGYIGAHDTRGLTTAPDGNIIVRNPWMRYFLDMHTYRKFNRFNLVDVYALGGSGQGPFAPIELKHPAAEQQQWANALLASCGKPSAWIAVQIGASDVMKAWRPGYFGQAMALMSQRLNVGFVLIGSKKESAVVQSALQAFKQADGAAPMCNAIGKTNLSQLIALLTHCHLMLTNDTGPMHLAVGEKVPIVNLSVGHVDFRETGPYGRNHWIIQPEIECGPCGFDQVCAHQSCKDRLLPRLVAEVCLHALGKGGVPTSTGGARLYTSGIDEDQLGTYTLLRGVEDPLQQWYGTFWRRFWYDDCTGQMSRTPGPSGQPPDFDQVQEVFTKLEPLLTFLCEAADEMVALTSQPSLSVDRITSCHARVNQVAHEARVLGRMCPAFSPITSAGFRDTYNLGDSDLHGMAREQAKAYATWQSRTREVIRQLTTNHTPTRRDVYAGSTR
ncbi:MAG: glycosyltransferase family 9 protein [Nitrospirales bacterium]|nr:glycosyltransferase family 9 protein [Nitrospira sp.]MDR4502371.1 glycosyltransferase family 9 protein [Nitrospirales bacterium]